MSLKRYEYKLIDPAVWHSDVPQIEEQLNSLGRQGWEIVGFVGGEASKEHGPMCLAKRKVKTHHRKHDEKLERESHDH